MKWAILLAAGGLALAGGCTGPQHRADERAKAAAKDYMELGIGYMRIGKLDLAMSNLERSVHADPDSSDAHNAIAVLYQQLGENGMARMHFDRAIKLDRANSSARNNYGRYLCMKGKIAEAEEQFTAAINNPLYRTPEIAYTNAGTCVLGKPDVQRAEQLLRSALNANPQYAPALLEMAKLSFEMQNYLSARAYLQRYAEVAPQSAESLWLGVRVERMLGDKDAVASYSLALRAKYPDSEQTRLLLESEKNDRRGSN